MFHGEGGLLIGGAYRLWSGARHANVKEVAAVCRLLKQLAKGKFNRRILGPQHALPRLAAALDGVDEGTVRLRVDDPDVLHAARKVVGDLVFHVSRAVIR